MYGCACRAHPRDEFGSGNPPVALRAPSGFPLPNYKVFFSFLPEHAILHNHRREIGQPGVEAAQRPESRVEIESAMSPAGAK